MLEILFRFESFKYETFLSAAIIGAVEKSTAHFLREKGAGPKRFSRKSHEEQND